MNTSPKQSEAQRFSWKTPAIYLTLPLFGAGVALLGDHWVVSSAVAQQSIAPPAAAVREAKRYLFDAASIWGRSSATGRSLGCL